MLQSILRGPAFWSPSHWNLKTASMAAVFDGAALLSFGLLTYLWAEVRSVPSIFWTASSAILMLFAAILGKAHLATERRAALFAAAFLAAYFLGSGLSYVFVSTPHNALTDLFIQNTILLLYASVYFMFGAVAGRKQLFVGFLLSYLFLAAYAIASREGFAAEELAKELEADRVAINYQQMGDSLVICALMIIALLRQKVAVFGVAILTIALLVIIPSRSALVFGATTLVLCMLLVASPRARILIIIVGLITVITTRYLILSNLSETFEGTRHSQLLTLQEDQSNAERIKILDKGWHQLAEHPFFGNFGFQLEAFNDSGMYIHNALDIWVQADLLPFLLFIALWVFLFRQWYLTTAGNRELRNQTLPMLVFPALSWLFSRHVAYVPLYFCVGYFSACLLLNHPYLGQMFRSRSDAPA